MSGNHIFDTNFLSEARHWYAKDGAKSIFRSRLNDRSSAISCVGICSNQRYTISAFIFSAGIYVSCKYLTFSAIFLPKSQWPNRNPFHIPLLFSEINQIYSPIHLVFCPFFTHRLSSNTIHKQMKRLFYLFLVYCVFLLLPINYNLLSISSSDEYKSQYNLI